MATRHFSYVKLSLIMPDANANNTPVQLSLGEAFTYGEKVVTYSVKSIVPDAIVRIAPVLLNYVSILPNRLVAYQQLDGSCYKKSKQPTLTKSEGKLSRKAASRLQNAIRLLVHTAKRKKVYQKSTNKWFSFKLSFITLTLPSAQMHSDKEIHEKIFKSFIRQLRNDKKEFLYLYKAEVQDNGNLHYHVTTNSFIHYQNLRERWNQCCEKLGYVSRSGIANPNSTDVHSVKNGDELERYLVSYCTKKDLYKKPLKKWHKKYKKLLSDKARLCVELPKNYFKNLKRKVEVKLWDCSKILKIGKLSMLVGNNDESKEIGDVINNADYVIRDDYYTLASIEKSQWAKSPILQKEWANFTKELYRKNQMQEDVIYLD